VRKYLFAYILAGILVLAGFLLSISVLGVPSRPVIDIAAINEITKQSALNWQNPE